MNLVTKCAACGTTFRVTEQQLQAHGGKVRCGQCKTVFDGLAGLVELPVAETAHAAAPEPPEFTLEPVVPAATTPAAAARELELAARSADYGPAPEQLSLGEEFYPAGEAPPRASRWWAAAAALLVLALGAQAAYFYRGELSVRVPGLKPYLVQACEAAGCVVTPPQRPRQIAIEASDLQATDAARPGAIQLTATLRNHAGHDVGYPAIDLVLTNTREHTLARRIFMPAEYLGGRRNVITGIPANAEITIRLDLDTGDLNPAGFRLDLLAAPTP